jgi:hypothetical protein
LLVILLVGFTGCLAVIGSSVDSGGGGGDSGSLGEEEEPPISCRVGAPCNLGESTVTLTRAEATDFIPTSLDNYEGNFVLVEFDYTYGGTKPAMIEDYYWTLEDGQGRTYNYAFDPTSSYEIDKNRALLYKEVNPDTKESGAIVFEVAPDAKDFTLHIRDLIRPQANKRADIPLQPLQ